MRGVIFLGQLLVLLVVPVAHTAVSNDCSFPSPTQPALGLATACHRDDCELEPRTQPYSNVGVLCVAVDGGDQSAFACVDCVDASVAST